MTIKLTDVSKSFDVPIKHRGKYARFKDMFYRRWKKVTVLKDINLDIKQGEFIGYIGPNGAGKSTTIKLMTGILSPTTGDINILGFNPMKDRYKYSYQIGVVFGQRSLLEFDIPVEDSLLLYKDIYEFDDKTFRKRIAHYSRILKIDKLMHIPVRKLSLGQRMRCEIAASLLHKPKSIFLDEPTIGLDALAKEEIRNFLTEINRKEKTTIILTTHDMEDIEALCKRVIVLDEGKVIYDDNLDDLKKRYVRFKRIEFTVGRTTSKLRSLLKKTDILDEQGNFFAVRIDSQKHDVPGFVKSLLATADVTDLAVSEPRLETVIKEIYKG